MPKTSSARGVGRWALKARHLAEAGVIGAFSLAAGAAPVRVRRAAGTAFGTALWAVDGRHRRVAAGNIRLAYGELMSPQEVRRLVLATRRHFGRLVTDVLAMPRFLEGDGAKRVRVEGFERVREAHERGAGILLVTGHLGNWELLAHMWANLGVPVAGIVRPLDNPYLDAWLRRVRTANGNRVIHRDGAIRQALRVLRQGGTVALPIDQRPKRGGYRVPFFGVDAYTTEGLGAMALGSRAAVFPAFMVNEADGTWRLAVEPEVPVVRTGDWQASGLRLTAECTAILERWVRSYPDQWLWTHRRWAQPREGAEPGRKGDAGAGS